MPFKTHNCILTENLNHMSFSILEHKSRKDPVTSSDPSQGYKVH